MKEVGKSKCLAEMLEGQCASEFQLGLSLSTLPGS